MTARIPRELPLLVHGDATRLRQILINLLGNALKFTEQGEIGVRASVTIRPDDRLVLALEVHDTGPGIAPEIQATIFDAFSQGDGSTTRNYGGTGLGLAISQQLARLMEGAIQIESTPGEGSIFTLRVWLDPAQGLAAPECIHPERCRAQRLAPVTEPTLEALSGRVLLVEDNAVNREMATLMLEDLGLTVTSAVNGEEAVQAVRDDNFALVLMDCHMPVMDGFDATQAIRGLERTRGGAVRLPIVALTANVEKGVREACAECGMDSYLSKPFSQRQLRAAIMPWLVATAWPPARVDEGVPLNAEDTSLETLDHAALAAIRDLQRPGQPDPLRIVFRLYQESSSELMDQIRRALEAGAAEDLRLAAHSLKSSSASLGGRRFVALCHDLEDSGRNGRLKEAGIQFARAEPEFVRLVAAIEHFMQLPWEGR